MRANTPTYTLIYDKYINTYYVHTYYMRANTPTYTLNLNPKSHTHVRANTPPKP
jgi:hypothetical protein